MIFILCLCLLIFALFTVVTGSMIISNGFSTGPVIMFIISLVCLVKTVKLIGQRSSTKKKTKRPAKDFTVKLNETDNLACAAFADGPEAVLRAIERSPEVQEAEDKAEARKQATTHAVPALINHALEDSVLTEEEEHSIEKIIALAGIDVAAVPSHFLVRMTQSAIVRDLLDGRIDPRITAAEVPFNLQKTEVPIWLWPDVTALQSKTVSEWVGRSQGMSIRIASGVYWRVGAARGHKVSREIQESLGNGPLLVTSRHVYFQGDRTAFRIRLDKIVSMRLYSDGVEIYQEGSSNASKPKTFLTDDAWFLINCLQNGQNWAK